MAMETVQVKLSSTELGYYRRESVEVLKVDFNSLFSVVHRVLIHTTTLAQKCLLGKDEIIIPERNKLVPSTNFPLDVLKRICCKVACGGESDKDEVSASIVNNVLQNYSWAERAVITLAAFSLSYGELLFFVEHQKLNSFARLISSLMQVDGFEGLKQEQQFKTGIAQLNELTNLLLQFIGSILQLNELSEIDYIDVTEIKHNVDLFSQFAVEVVVQCMSLVHYLTCERIKTGLDLSSTITAVESAIQSIQKIIVAYKSQIDAAAEWDAYSKLHTSIRSGRGIVEVMTHMMFPGEALLERWNNTPVTVDKLKGKNVVLFISRLDNISKYDFDNLVEIHNMLERDHQDYKIVWIPFLEDSISGEEESDDWPMGLMKDFDTWKEKMPWYIVNYERSKQIVGIKYIKERWYFNYNPIVVILNSRGEVQSSECPDVMPMIRAWQTRAFPFNGKQVPDHGIGPIIFNIRKKAIDKNEYIFLYGGKDQAWVNDFGTNVRKLVSDKVLENAKITLTSLAIKEEKNSTSIDIGQFWTSIESMLCVRMQWGLSYEMTKEIQKALSYKDKKGWAMLCKGNRVLACASESIILEAVAEWKVWTKDIGSTSFEICFVNHLKKKQIGGGRLPCSHVPFKSLSGWIPVNVECPDCGARMERIVTYNCCHDALYKK